MAGRVDSDEADPATRDPELDLYDPRNPNQPPIARASWSCDGRRRSIAIAGSPHGSRANWPSSKAAGRYPTHEFAFVVHGTMADPPWLTPTVDPNVPCARHLLFGDPQTVNMSPVGLARFCTWRSWLSQWSYDDARADGVACGRDIGVPALVIGNLADDACTPSHTRRLYEAIRVYSDKEFHEIPGATHYYAGR